jgi:hypothetical protein
MMGAADQKTDPLGSSAFPVTARGKARCALLMPQCRRTADSGRVSGTRLVGLARGSCCSMMASTAGTIAFRHPMPNVGWLRDATQTLFDTAPSFCQVSWDTVIQIARPAGLRTVRLAQR